MKKAILVVITGGLMLTIFAIAAIVGLYILGAKRAEERALAAAGHKPAAAEQHMVAKAAKKPAVAANLAKAVTPREQAPGQPEATIDIEVTEVTPEAASATTVDAAKGVDIERAVVIPEYPKREKGDAQYRDAVRVSAGDVFTWLTTPAFFEPEALENVAPRVVDAKRHLNALFACGEYQRLLTPEQITAIICRETCTDDKRALVNLNCLGDRSMHGYQKAHGPLQISKRAYDSVDAIEGFGLIGPDFHGDLALSELVFQAWVFEHCDHDRGTPEDTFQWMCRFWNAGPTGARNGGAYGYYHGDKRRGVKQYLAEVVRKQPSVIVYNERQKTTDGNEQQLLATAAPAPQMRTVRAIEPSKSVAGGTQIGTVEMPMLVARPIVDENEETRKVLTAQSPTTAGNEVQFYGPAPGTAERTGVEEAFVRNDIITGDLLFPVSKEKPATKVATGLGVGARAATKSITINLPAGGGDSEGGTQ